MSRLLTTGVTAARRRLADPLAGISFALRLQTHRGDGIPFGLFQDAACTVPAMVDGDPVGGWRDMISGSAAIFAAPDSGKRPTLRFTGGIPWVDPDGVDDLMLHTPGSSLTGERVFFSSGFGFGGGGSYERLFSSHNGTEDYASGSFIPCLRHESNLAIGDFYSGFYRTSRAMANATWFTYQVRKTGTAVDSFLNGGGKQSAVISGALTASVLSLFGPPQGGSGSEHWGGGGQFFAISNGNLSDGEIATVADYQQSLLP